LNNLEIHANKLNIIFVCYHCGTDIKNAIEDIKKGEYPIENLNVFIVDNASQDDSVNILKSIKNIDINIIESPDNLGFGSGCNLAIKQIDSGEKTLFLNPDIRLKPDSITKLVQFSDKTLESRLWGGKTFDVDGNEDGKNAWKEPSLFGVFSWSFFLDILFKKFGLAPPDAYSLSDLKKSNIVDSISGCFLLIETKLLKEINGFDERFFMYSEEIDLCRRAREKGATPRSTDSAYIIHEGSKTLNSANKLNFLYHSKLLYAKKHWSSYKFWLARAFIYMGSFARFTAHFITSIFIKSNKENADLWAGFLKKQTEWKF